MAELDDGSVLVREIRRLADATGRLLRQHVDLAKVELQEEAKKVGTDAALVVSALPFLLTAQLLLSAAVALWIAEALGAPWAFAIVGGANLLAGLALAILGARKLRGDARGRLPATTEELQRDRRMMRELRDGGGSPARVLRDGDAELPDR